jgi:hypothetical protein
MGAEMADDAPVEKSLAVRICDYAHDGSHASLLGHRSGFCLTCAEIYLAVNKAMLNTDGGGDG